MDYLFLPYLRYFDFAGRSNRSEYWAFMLFYLVTLIITMIAAGLFDYLLVGSPELQPGLESVGLPLGLFGLFTLFSLIPMLALSVRRFHDAGFSGWLYLGLSIASLVPYLGWLASLAILVISVLPSDSGNNQWGDNPHGFGTDHLDMLREDYRAGKGVRYR